MIVLEENDPDPDHSVLSRALMTFYAKTKAKLAKPAKPHNPYPFLRVQFMRNRIFEALFR